MEIKNSTHLPEGTSLLNGKYKIQQFLSAGGFGNTYKAVMQQDADFASGTLQTTITIAIKEFFMHDVNTRADDGRTVLIGNPKQEQLFYSQLRKFQNEARILSGINNEHIVKVIDLIDENGTFYYVMEFIDGQSLDQKLNSNGIALPESEVIGYLNQIIEALDDVHGKNLLHLDLKPSNIMLTRSGVIKLIDFGTCKQVDSNGELTTTLGGFTKGYAPLEQVEQDLKRMGPWTDVYALGASLYKLLTGKLPPMQSDIQDDGIKAFDYSDVNVSDKMQNLILLLMAPRIKERAQSIAEVRTIIDTLWNGNVMVVNALPKLEHTIPQPQTQQHFQQSYQPQPYPYAPQQPVSQSTQSNNQSWMKWAVIVLGICVLTGLGIILYNLGSGSDVSENEGASTESQVQTKYGPCDEVIDVNGVQFGMINIAGGTYMMGAVNDIPAQGDDNEYPVHKVTLSDFKLGQTEVTQELWDAVMGSNPSKNVDAEHPVENVRWADCKTFISKLNSLTGKHFRLPTEAELEYVARGGINQEYTIYSGSNAIDEVAWYNGNCGGHARVASKKANTLGLFDVTGNVWEWCHDYYKASYPSDEQIDPQGPSSGDAHVMRGGSWNDPASNCRVTNRRYNNTGFKSGFTGLRLAM